MLSICEENSDETEEYILDHSILNSIKQEQTVNAQTNNSHSHLQPTNSVTTAPSQYRVINQTGKIINTNSFNSPLINASSELNANSLNSLNLPPGCEIYVIKEVYDSPKKIIAESAATAASSKTISATGAGNRKLEQTQRLINDNNGIRNLGSSSNYSIGNTRSPITSSTTTTTANGPDDTTKRSLILEAYKKRDDKRRATHNEVERRRRDKINSWIFKLKEMLPTEVTNYD